jgi:hypothetical protein
MVEGGRPMVKERWRRQKRWWWQQLRDQKMRAQRERGEGRKEPHKYKIEF